MSHNPNQSNCMGISHMLLLVLLFATTTCTLAYNITYFLTKHPDFSTFNDLLTKTSVDDIINNLNSTMTVLAVDNSAMGSLSSQSQSSQETMMAAHVLLDYFDTTKLKEMKDGSQVTNLYQKTGKTSGKQGYIKVTKDGNDIIFSSPVDGAPKSSRLVKEVESKPFDVVVLQISTPIVVPGLNNTPITPSPSPSSSPSPSQSQSPSPSPSPSQSQSQSQSQSPSPSPSPSQSPSPSSSSSPSPISSPALSPMTFIVPAPAPDADVLAADDYVADGPEADGPEADGPEAEGPGAEGSPAPSPDLADEEAADVDDEPPAELAPTNGGDQIMVNVGGLVAGVFIRFLVLAL